MKYMNEYDLASAAQRLERTPNRATLVAAVRDLAEWADCNSDGWAYWPLPSRAAQRAIGHIESTTNRANDEQERTDITGAELAAALKPIRTFLSRQGRDPSEVLGAA